MFSLIIPLFNESKNIEPLLKEIELSLRNYTNYDIILINDASFDNTYDVINRFKNKNIKIINNEINKGQSYSVHKGINKSKNDIVITIDGDGQNDPKDISKLLELYLSDNSVMLVGGLRKKWQDNLIKIYSSKIANFIRSIILKDNCSDTGCSLKVFNREIFLSFPYFNGMHRFLPALFKGFGYKTKFIEVSHRKRKHGISKYGTMNRLFKGIRDIYIVKKILKNKK